MKISCFSTICHHPRRLYHFRYFGSRADYFRAVLRLLKEAEREDTANLVLMGIEPTYPSEKYSYIMPVSQESQSKEQAFKEKSDKESAEKYIAQGHCGTAAFLHSNLAMHLIKRVNFLTIRIMRICSIAMRS